jgi:hypothetical protein
MSSRCCRCCWNGEPSSNGDEDGRAFDRLRGRGQGVQQSHGATVPQGAQDRSGDPDQSRQSVRPRLRPGGVARAQRRGAAHQPPQAMAADRDSLRKASGQLPGNADRCLHPPLALTGASAVCGHRTGMATGTCIGDRLETSTTAGSSPSLRSSSTMSGRHAKSFRLPRSSSSFSVQCTS